MLWEKKRRFGKLPLFVMVSMIVLVTAGCSNGFSEVSDSGVTVADNEVSSLDGSDFADAISIAAVYRDIYEEAAETNTLGSLETLRRIVMRLGENGYVAVDSENQIDMANAEQAAGFCKAVDEKKNAKLTIVVIKDFGFWKYDLETEDGNVNIVRGYYQYDSKGYPQNRSTVSYPVDVWQYTEEGYLLFEGSYFSDESFILTLSDTPEHTALRVLPLDEKCRELNRKYILPVGYGWNNIFLIDWNEEDFGDLNFYDVFDKFYPMIYGQSVPYTMDNNVNIGAVYQIPEELFENVIQTYIDIDSAELRSRTVYFSENEAYEYKPRGFYELEADSPYPEVVSYSVSDADEENQDGTITLIINAVYPNENTSKAFSHEVLICPLSDGSFRYMSNRMLSPEDDYDTWWHSDRLTEEEWKSFYGGIE